MTKTKTGGWTTQIVQQRVWWSWVKQLRQLAKRNSIDVIDLVLMEVAADNDRTITITIGLIYYCNISYSVKKWLLPEFIIEVLMTFCRQYTGGHIQAAGGLLQTWWTVVQIRQDIQHGWICRYVCVTVFDSVCFHVLINYAVSVLSIVLFYSNE